MCLRKSIIILACIVLSFCASAQLKKSKKPEAFRHNQYVIITMKDGSEVPARISSVKSVKRYWVRMMGGNRRGLVHRKFMREMTSSEILMLKKSNTEPKTRN